MSGEREGHLIEENCRGFARSCGCREQRRQQIPCNGIIDTCTGAIHEVANPRRTQFIRDCIERLARQVEHEAVVPYRIPKGTGFHAFRLAYNALIAQVGTDDAKKVKVVQMKLLRQGDERTNNRYGKSAPPLRQRARQAHINVSDLAMGEAASWTNRKVDQIWTTLQG